MEETKKQSPEEELELSDEQVTRADEVYEAVFEMCKVLTEQPDLEWDMAMLGEIADFAAEHIASMGHKVRFPSVVTEEDGTQYIEEYTEGR